MSACARLVGCGICLTICLTEDIVGVSCSCTPASGLKRWQTCYCMQVLDMRYAKYPLSAIATPAMGHVRAAQPNSPLSIQPRTASQLALTPSDGTDSWRPRAGVRSPHSVSQAPVRRSRRAPQQTASEASLPSIAEEEQHATADALLELASDPSHVSS